MLRHGGELQITSQPGRGACFALLFPAQRVRDGVVCFLK